MDIYAEIFRDQFIQEIGQSLLTYFESKEFPTQLLRNPTLNLLYLKAQLHNIVNDKSLSDVERYALTGAAIDAYHERGGKSPPFPEKVFRYKFSSPGVEK